MLKTLRQPFQSFPIMFFPAMLLAVNASGLAAGHEAARLPHHSYTTFAIAVAFIQGAMFSLINTGTNLAEDIETGFFNRLALTPLRRVSLIADCSSASRLLGAPAVGGVHRHRPDRGRPPAAGDWRRRSSSSLLGVARRGRLRRVRLRRCPANGLGRGGPGLFPLFFVFIFLSSSNLPAQPAEDGLVSHGGDAGTRSPT